MSTPTLQELAAQISEKKRLGSMLSDMLAQQKELQTRLDQLKRTAYSEQKDVDRLEGRSLSALFYQFTGQIDDKLDTERREAAAARIKYEAAVHQITALDEDIRCIQNQLTCLEGCEERYERALEQTLEQLRRSGSTVGLLLCQIETSLLPLYCQKKELREARAAGQKALHLAEDLCAALDSAEGLGTWDLFTDGGFILETAKHSELDNAQALANRLQLALQCFRSELADVTIDASIQAATSGFLQFADFFFDSFIADWAVLDHINHAQQQTNQIRSQILETLHTLSLVKADVTAQIDGLQKEKEQLALENSKGAMNGDQ